MITTKGQIIEINDKTEWLLFHRLTKKINPVDFLTLTDSIIQFPNFLFTISFLILIFLNFDVRIKFIVPASLYFFGQILINLHLGVMIIKLLNVPLLIFQKFSFIIMPAHDRGGLSLYGLVDIYGDTFVLACGCFVNNDSYD